MAENDKNDKMMEIRPGVWTFASPIRVMAPDFAIDAVAEFVQKMFNRTAVSFHKYGSIHDNFPHNRTGIDNAQIRLDCYRETGNVEELVDAANYLLIEALCPSHPDAHFRATDSDESPGALNRDGTVSHGKD